MHTAGWPLDAHTYGGGFLYHMENNQIAIGFTVGAGYSNPYLSPFEEFQRLKTHPVLRGFFTGGKRLAYGARAITAGGVQSLPKLVFPGGALIGDDAGFLNASRIKGSHTAIKSGALAAEACFDAVVAGRQSDELTAFPEAYRKSWLYEELYKARNFKPWMSKGLYLGSLMFGIDQILLRGKAPWTLRHHHADHTKLNKASECQRIEYPKPDGGPDLRPLVIGLPVQYQSRGRRTLSPDAQSMPQCRSMSIWHFMMHQKSAIARQEFTRIVREPDGSNPRLQINAQNCVHCKTCDIKDPTQNIVWVAPQGGEGPELPEYVGYLTLP